MYKDFAAEKEELLNEDGDEEIPTQELPGWVSIN